MNFLVTNVVLPVFNEDSITLTASTFYPDLLDMVKRLEPGWVDPSVLRRQIFRTNMPNAGIQAGVHYDQIYLRYGPPTAITAWLPLGNCSPVSGGIIYLEDSVEMGKTLENDFTAMSRSKGFTEKEERVGYNANVSQ